MLSQTAMLKSFFNDEVTVVELPYGSGNWVMDLIMPGEGNSIDDLIKNFSETNLNMWLDEMSDPGETSIIVPPFKFGYEEVLNDILKSMGMAIAFNPNEADFSRIAAEKQLYISELKHKTYIEVNEEGTEAAAVTSVEMNFTSVGDDSPIIFDRPFLFVIWEVSSGVMFFMGKVGDPER